MNNNKFFSWYVDDSLSILQVWLQTHSLCQFFRCLFVVRIQKFVTFWIHTHTHSEEFKMSHFNWCRLVWVCHNDNKWPLWPTGCSRVQTTKPIQVTHVVWSQAWLIQLKCHKKLLIKSCSTAPLRVCVSTVFCLSAHWWKRSPLPWQRFHPQPSSPTITVKVDDLSPIIQKVKSTNKK